MDHLVAHNKLNDLFLLEYAEDGKTLISFMVFCRLIYLSCNIYALENRSAISRLQELF